MLTKEEILKFIEEDKLSTKKAKAKVGQMYYEGEHDIKDYRLFYYNSDGELVEDKTRTNIKISHPFFTELVDQEVQYILSGSESIIQSDEQKLQEYLNDYFDDDFIAELQDVLTGTIAKGFDYMYAYVNSDGKLSFQYADSTGVVEVRGKDTIDGNDYIIHSFKDRIVKEDKEVTRVQVWDSEKTTYYVQEKDGELELDASEKINPRPHLAYTKENDDAIYYEDFGFIPFFRLDNNKKQTSGLKPIKGIIDDYDMMSCGLSNNLADFDNPIHVVKGFQGDNLDELQKNLKTKKMIGVGENGGVEVHTVDIPYQARLVKMQEDEKNIYKFGMGFNSAQLGDGNITNIVIKSRYALLDLKCNKLQIKLKQFLKKIVKIVLGDINKNNTTDYQMKDVKWNFEREVITNASDNALINKTEAETRLVEINTILSVASILDDESIIRMICELLDLDFDEVKEAVENQEEDETLSLFSDPEHKGVEVVE